jgi:hypothetical protein
MFVGVRSTVGVRYEVDERYGNVPRALAARWTYHWTYRNNGRRNLICDYTTIASGGDQVPISIN